MTQGITSNRSDKKAAGPTLCLVIIALVIILIAAFMYFHPKAVDSGQTQQNPATPVKVQ